MISIIGLIVLSISKMRLFSNLKIVQFFRDKMMSYHDASANVVEGGTTVAVEIVRNPIHCIGSYPPGV
jgi:hypothetical protein